MHMGSTQQSYVKFLNSNRVNFNVISVKMVEFMTVQSRQVKTTTGHKLPSSVMRLDLCFLEHLVDQGP